MYYYKKLNSRKFNSRSDKPKKFVFRSYTADLKCPLKNTTPFIMKNLHDVYFIYKPPFWNCVTYGPDFIKIKKQIKDENRNNNLILDWIRDNLYLDKSIATYEYDFGLINRLDFETSGILIVVKHLSKRDRYIKNINEHLLTTKIYIALVKGDIEHLFGVVTLPLNIDTTLRRTLIDYKEGKHAYTEYIKIATYEYNGEKYSLVMVKIKTGRTHQIRVHMNSIGHGILCDTKYENKKTLSESCNLTKRLFLHAYYYKLDDRAEAIACLPHDLQDALDKMKLIRTFYDMNIASKILGGNVITQTIIRDNEIDISKGITSKNISRSQYKSKYRSKYRSKPKYLPIPKTRKNAKYNESNSDFSFIDNY